MSPIFLFTVINKYPSKIFLSLHSTLIKAARIEILKLKEDIMREIRDDALKKAMGVVGDKARYQKFLFDSTYQALVTLSEPKAKVYCRKEDFEYLMSIKSQLQKQLKDKDSIDTEVTVSDHEFLQCIGGTSCSGLNDKIRINNTIDERLALSFDAMIPEIRDKLKFPKETL